MNDVMISESKDRRNLAQISCLQIEREKYHDLLSRYASGKVTERHDESHSFVKENCLIEKFIKEVGPETYFGK